jgi:Tfp pilus assembly protein PilV
MTGKLGHLRRDESGIILIEIVVSAMLLVIVALGVFTAFDAGTRATAEERHRARAHSLAEADVERMRAMRVADLSGLNETRTTTVDGLSYTIRSQATFGTETATTSTCAAGTGSRDTLLVSSTVTWPSIGSRPPVRVSSVVAPPNGSVVPNSGSLLASVKDSRGTGLAGVAMSGSGTSSFTGTTGAGGCVMWRNLQAGNYTLGFGGAAIGKVDPDGNAPSSQTVSVVAGSTNTVSYEFDSPGRVQNVQFRTRDYGNNLEFMTWDSIVVGHTSMQSPRVFNSTSGRQPSLSTPQTLYPFVTPYTVYAGTCGANDPVTGLGIGSVIVPVGGTVTGPTIQLPSLQVTLFSGSSASNPGSRVQGGDITVEDEDCGITRTLTTNTDTNGRVPDDASGRPMIGLPYGEYDVCANNSAQNDRRTINDFDLTTVGGSGTTLNVYLGGTSGGSCP